MEGLIRVPARELPVCPAWAEALSLAVPEAAWPALREGRGDAPAQEVVRALREHAAFIREPPTSSRLPFSYQRVPPRVRSALAGMLGRWQRRRQARWAAFPQWPLDLSADLLADAIGEAPSPFAQGPAPVILSHDLDSGEGLANLVGRFLALEEAVGAHSVNFVVPCAWPLDHGLLEEVRSRGHELGIHGYDHANRTPFVARSERARRLEAARELIARYDMGGYRAPSLMRTRALLRDLAQHYRYDSSIPTSGGLFPVPNNGCATARPFMVEGIAEIPVSMPRDGSLRFLGHSPREILATWIDCAETIARSGGVVVLLTHCEQRFSGNETMLGAYRAFLEYVAGSPRFAWSTPAPVLERALRPGRAV